MDWKGFLVFIALLLIFGVLVFLDLIPSEVGTILQTITAIAGLSLDYFLKPKIDLKIENIKIERREVLNLKGYFVSAKVINKGKRIAYNITPEITIEYVHNKKLIDKAILFRVEKNTKGEGMEILTDEVDLDNQLIYSPGWRTHRVLLSGGPEKFNQLRKDESVEIRYPFRPFSEVKLKPEDKTKIPNLVHLLQLKPQEKYQVKIKLTAEDSEQNSLTIEKTKTITPKK